MKPENYIDENYIPTEEDFAPEKVDKKVELRKSIKKSSCFWIITSFFVRLYLPLLELMILLIITHM